MAKKTPAQLAATQRWRDKNRPHIKAYNDARAPELREYKRNYSNEYYATHKEECLAKNKAWMEANKEHRHAYEKEYRQANKDKRNAKRLERYSTDPAYKLECTLRARMAQKLNRAKIGRESGTMELLGCSTGRLMEYLTAHFQPGMNWHNQGNGVDQWNLDHRLPISSFNLTDPEQQKQAFNWLNLQPLWSRDNFAKSAKVTKQPESPSRTTHECLMA